MTQIVVCPKCSKKLAIDVSNPKASFCCPGCQEVVRIESALLGTKVAQQPSSQQANRPSPSRSTAPSKPDNQHLPVSNAIVANDSKIQVSCSCGAKLKVPAAQNGKAVRCPKCQSTVDVPKLRAMKSIAESAPKPAQTPVQKPAPVDNSVWDELPSIPAPSFAPSNTSTAYGSPYANKPAKRAKSNRMPIGVAIIAGNYRYTAFFCLAMVVGPILSMIGCRDQQFHEKLDKVGITVPGEIDTGKLVSGRKGRKTYTFNVIYKPQGSPRITRSFNVVQSFFDQHTEGELITDDQVQVRYLPGQPNTAILIGGTEKFGQMIWVGILFLLVGIIALILRVAMNLSL